MKAPRSGDFTEVVPPSSVTIVDLPKKPVLYDASGMPLGRPGIGFQTTKDKR